MVSKLFEEEGDYICKETGESRNMVIGNEAHTPEGLNVGWDIVADEAEAMALYNIERKPIEEDIEKDI
jgi:hypothetical protein